MVHNGGELLGNQLINLVDSLIDGVGQVTIPGQRARHRLLGEVRQQIFGRIRFGLFGGSQCLVKETDRKCFTGGRLLAL